MTTKEATDDGAKENFPPPAAAVTAAAPGSDGAATECDASALATVLAPALAPALVPALATALATALAPALTPIIENSVEKTVESRIGELQRQNENAVENALESRIGELQRQNEDLQRQNDDLLQQIAALQSSIPRGHYSSTTMARSSNSSSSSSSSESNLPGAAAEAKLKTLEKCLGCWDNIHQNFEELSKKALEAHANEGKLIDKHGQLVGELIDKHRQLVSELINKHRQLVKKHLSKNVISDIIGNANTLVGVAAVLLPEMVKTAQEIYSSATMARSSNSSSGSNLPFAAARASNISGEKGIAELAKFKALEKYVGLMDNIQQDFKQLVDSVVLGFMQRPLPGVDDAEGFEHLVKVRTLEELFGRDFEQHLATNDVEQGQLVSEHEAQTTTLTNAIMENAKSLCDEGSDMLPKMMMETAQEISQKLKTAPVPFGFGALDDSDSEESDDSGEDLHIRCSHCHRDEGLHPGGESKCYAKALKAKDARMLCKGVTSIKSSELKKAVKMVKKKMSEDPDGDVEAIVKTVRKDILGFQA